MNGFRSRGVGGDFLGGVFAGGGGNRDDGASQQLDPNAVVNDRRYVLSDSNAERLEEKEEQRDISEIDSQAATSYRGASLSEIDSRASTDTTGQSTHDASSSEEATTNSFVSRFGYLTNSSGGSDQGYGYDDDDDNSNGPPPVSPPGASLVQDQANGVGFGLSPIANVNATHVHNASMASPGLDGNIEDEDEDVPPLSNGPSPELRIASNTADDTVRTSQLQDLLEENALATNECKFLLPDEGEREEESAGTSDIDISDMEPTESALAMASDAPWSEGQRFNRGTPIFAIRLVLSKYLLRKGFKGIDACLVYVQTRPNGRFILYSRRKRDCGSFVVDLLREIGQDGLLTAAAKSAYLGEARNHEIPGGSKEVDSSNFIANPRDIMVDDDGVRTARRAFCFADSVFNVIVAIHRDLAIDSFDGESDIGVFLRVRWCDEYGKMIASFDDIMNMTTQSNEFPFNLARCTNRRLPGIEDGNFGHKMEYLLTLSAKEPARMFVLQCVSKDDGSTSHFVGLSNSTVYDNCASTGGKFAANEYAKEHISGVRKAAEIILRPRSNKNKTKKKKRNKNQKRGLTLEQDENESVQKKKARQI